MSPDFLRLLLPQIAAILAPAVLNSSITASKDAEKDKDKDERDRLARQRPVLRIMAELALIAAWPEGVMKGVGEISKVLKAQVGLDRLRTLVVN